MRAVGLAAKTHRVCMGQTVLFQNQCRVREGSVVDTIELQRFALLSRFAIFHFYL